MDVSDPYKNPALKDFADISEGVEEDWGDILSDRMGTSGEIPLFHEENFEELDNARSEALKGGIQACLRKTFGSGVDAHSIDFSHNGDDFYCIEFNHRDENDRDGQLKSDELGKRITKALMRMREAGEKMLAQPKEGQDR